jgi:hypothetical protein
MIERVENQEFLFGVLDHFIKGKMEFHKSFYEFVKDGEVFYVIYFLKEGRGKGINGYQIKGYQNDYYLFYDLIEQLLPLEEFDEADNKDLRNNMILELLGEADKVRVRLYPSDNH